MMLFDTHCHLDYAAFDGRLANILHVARTAGVVKYIVPGVHPAQWVTVEELTRNIGYTYPAFGLHPMHADVFSDDVGATLQRMLAGAVATGEIGLDYALPNVPREMQMVTFREQLRLSVAMGLPVLIHCRKAFPDLLRILKEEDISSVGGAMHAFSGSPEVARECMQLGLLISVAGAVTYINAVKPLKVVKQVPLSFLLLETDAPDMAPEPYRGLVNEPAFIVETANKVAKLKEVTLEEVAMQTMANAETLFRLRER